MSEGMNFLTPKEKFFQLSSNHSDWKDLVFSPRLGICGWLWTQLASRQEKKILTENTHWTNGKLQTFVTKKDSNIFQHLVWETQLLLLAQEKIYTTG